MITTKQSLKNKRKIDDRAEECGETLKET